MEQQRLIRMIKVTGAVAILAAVAIAVLAVFDGALAVVVAIMLIGLAVVVLPFESIRYDRNQPSGHH